MCSNNVTGFEYTSFHEQKAVTRYSVNVGLPEGGDNLWAHATLQERIGGFDPFARTITMQYDNVGRKTVVTQPSVASYFFSGTEPTVNAGSITPVSAAAMTRYDYTVFGEVRRESVQIDNLDHNGDGIAEGRTRDTWHYYDVMGRESVTVDVLGFQTLRVYDEFGNVRILTEYANAGAHGSLEHELPPVLPSESSADRITSYSYDERNQLRMVARRGLRYVSVVNDTTYTEVNTTRDVSTVVSSTTYDGLGQVLTQSDALGNVTRTDYDALGRVSRVTQPARLTAGSSIDPFLGQVSVTPVTSFTYNAFAQVVQQVHSSRVDAQGNADASAPGARITQQHYDLGGNLIESIDARGNAKRFTLDYAGRVLKELQSVEATRAKDLVVESQTLERRYAYDALGRRLAMVEVYQEVHWNDDGSATRAPMQSGTNQLYNAFGEVVEERRVWGAASATIESLTDQSRRQSQPADRRVPVRQCRAPDHAQLGRWRVQLLLRSDGAAQARGAPQCRSAGECAGADHRDRL